MPYVKAFFFINNNFLCGFGVNPNKSEFDSSPERT